MATAYLDPNADGAQTGWTKSGTPHTYYYEYVNSGARDPDAGNTDDYLAGDTNGNKQDLHMETIGDVGSATAVEVYAYMQRAGPPDADAKVQVYMGGSWQTAQNLSIADSWAWKSATFEGSWTQADVNALQVRFEADLPSGGVAQLADCYVVLTYSTGGGGGARSFVVD